MPLDKETLTRIFNKSNSIVGSKNPPISTERIFNAMQAIYDLAIKEERERCARVCESSEIPFDIDVWCDSTKKEMTARTALWLAEAIRKG